MDPGSRRAFFLDRAGSFGSATARLARDDKYRSRGTIAPEVWFNSALADARGRSAGRRTLHFHAWRGAARAWAKRARLPALRCGDFSPRDRASGDQTKRSSRSLAPGFRPARPVPVQPLKAVRLSVRTDGDPRPPGAQRARQHSGRRPRSACRTPPEGAPLVERGVWNLFLSGRKSIARAKIKLGNFYPRR